MSQPLTELSEEEQIFRQMVRDFAEERVRPRVEEMERAAAHPPDMLRALFEMGLMGIEVPEKYGGAGASFFMSILAIEELSRVDPAMAIPVDVQNTLVVNQLLHWATEEQKERFLPRMVEDTIGSYALSEAGSGSDAFALKTSATLSGDRYLLNGQKLWISNAAEAGLFIVFATVDASAGYRGVTAFIVERDTPGFRVGRKEDKLGIRASSTCELVLDGCKIPGDRVLGEVGQGYKIAIETLNIGRIGIGAQMIGVTAGALEAATQYTKERSQFGKKISEFQAVQHQLATCATRLEAAKLLVYNAARLCDSGQSFIREAAMAKLFSGDTAEFVTSAAVELFGGYGYTTEYPVEKFYRDAKIGKIYEGTSFMQLNTIAKLLLEE